MFPFFDEQNENEDIWEQESDSSYLGTDMRLNVLLYFLSLFFPTAVVKNIQMWTRPREQRTGFGGRDYCIA